MLVKHGPCPSMILLWLCSSNSCEHSFILDNFVPRNKITVASSSLKATWAFGILCYLGFMCRFLCPILMRSYRHLSSIELTFLSSASIDGLWTMSKHCAPPLLSHMLLNLLLPKFYLYRPKVCLGVGLSWKASTQTHGIFSLFSVSWDPGLNKLSIPSQSHPIPKDPPLSSSYLPIASHFFFYDAK